MSQRIAGGPRNEQGATRFLVSGSIGALSCACGPQPADAIRLASTVPLGMVAHWAFDEGSGTTAIDHSGNGRHGTVTSGTWREDGRFGGALRLVAGDHITVATFPDATPSFSVSAWVRVNEFSQVSAEDPERWGVVISTEVVLAGGWEVVIERSLPSPAVNFAFWTGPDIGDYSGWTCECLQLGAWTHVVGMRDDNLGVLSLFVDGQLRGTLPAAQSILPGSPTLMFGRHPAGGRSLDGDIDEIAVWSRALVPEEVNELNQHSLPAQP